MAKEQQAKQAVPAQSEPEPPSHKMKQLSLRLEMDLGTPVAAWPKEIEAEVIGHLAEAIKSVYAKGKEEESDEQ
jgi:hypothetical protein